MKHGSEERREQFLTKHETRDQSEYKRRGRRKRDSKKENLNPSSLWASSSLTSQLFKGLPLSILLNKILYIF